MVKLIKNGVDLCYDGVALRGLRLGQVYSDSEVLSSVFNSLLKIITISLDIFLEIQRVDGFLESFGQLPPPFTNLTTNDFRFGRF